MNIGFTIFVIAGIGYIVHILYLHCSVNKECEKTFQEAEKLNREID